MAKRLTKEESETYRMLIEMAYWAMQSGDDAMFVRMEERLTGFENAHLEG